MKRATVISVVCVGLAAGPALAGAPSSEKPPAASKAKGSVEKSFEGKVTDFASGKLITISADGDKSHTFRLDARDVTAIVESGIAVGARVKVVESIDATGKRTVTVKLAPAP